MTGTFERIKSLLDENRKALEENDTIATRLRTVSGERSSAATHLAQIESNVEGLRTELQRIRQACIDTSSNVIREYELLRYSTPPEGPEAEVFEQLKAAADKVVRTRDSHGVPSPASSWAASEI